MANVQELVLNDNLISSNISALQLSAFQNNGTNTGEVTIDLQVTQQSTHNTQQYTQQHGSRRGTPSCTLEAARSMLHVVCCVLYVVRCAACVTLEQPLVRSFRC